MFILYGLPASILNIIGWSSLLGMVENVLEFNRVLLPEHIRKMPLYLFDNVCLATARKIMRENPWHGLLRIIFKNYPTKVNTKMIEWTGPME
jgi:hypothetical protein